MTENTVSKRCLDIIKQFESELAQEMQVLAGSMAEMKGKALEADNLQLTIERDQYRSLYAATSNELKQYKAMMANFESVVWRAIRVMNSVFAGTEPLNSLNAITVQLENAHSRIYTADGYVSENGWKEYDRNPVMAAMEDAQHVSEAQVRVYRSQGWSLNESEAQEGLSGDEQCIRRFTDRHGG